MRDSYLKDLNSPSSSSLKFIVGGDGVLTVITAGYKAFFEMSVSDSRAHPWDVN